MASFKDIKAKTKTSSNLDEFLKNTSDEKETKLKKETRFNVSFYLNAEEKRLLEEKAKQAGMPLSVYIRFKALSS